MKINKLLTVLAVAGLFVTAPSAQAEEMEQPSIVDIASGNPAFSTLVAAVVKAELVDALNADRNFTVFAPTNDAFDAAAVAVLGEGNNGIDLINALDKDTLKGILLYHVSPGERFSDAVLAAKRIRTMSKGFLMVDGITLKGANSSANLVIGLTDLDARNGVVHVIDFVLLP